MSEQRIETRIGQGVDIHVLKLHAPYTETNARCITLCGLTIPCDYYLDGHSDADAPLHALTDALLGAVGKGDIGQHFPPTDPQWRDADSRTFVYAALEMLKEACARIVNCDITILTETPKIAPYRDAMRKQLADIMAIDESRINVKATTAETLGFIGRQEGLMALANVSVETPFHQT